MTAVRDLVAEIIDYAGLFPPAKLPLDQVVQNYAEYLDGQAAWMLARLILPASRLEEIESINAFSDSQRQWRISALIPQVDAENDAFDNAMRTIGHLNRRHRSSENSKMVINTVEVKTPSVDLIRLTNENMPQDLSAFLEIPYAADPADHIHEISHSGDNIFAKIRTGGVTNDLIPTPNQVARFIAECAKQNVGFKATAGLHHPLRGDFRLTYDEHPEIGTMFGFINVFAAACFAFSIDISETQLESVLTESNPDAFEFSANKLTWGGLSVSSEQVKTIRQTKAVSFGSCSFTEPTTELAELGWLDGVEVV